MLSTAAWDGDRPPVSGESVTQWIDHLKGGDREAVQRLFERYYGRLVREARRWLRRAPAAPAADEEDVAQGAFAIFCRRAEEGRFPRLSDRDDFWQLLLVIAFHKTCSQIVHERRRRPAGGRARRRRRRRRRSAGGCWPRWAARSCARWRCGSWRVTPTRRSPR